MVRANNTEPSQDAASMDLACFQAVSHLQDKE